MNKIRLFIENKEVELTKDINFAITKQFEDLSNPTTIINDWSKTIEIPFTQTNNKLFGELYNIDKAVDNESALISMNPLAKVSFRLVYLDDTIMSGYIKLNSISRKDGNGSYNVSLFGELGKIFREMQKLTFEPEQGIDDYHIEGERYFYEKLNAQTVVKGFEDKQSTLILKDKTDADYKYTDIIGFTPSNAYKSLFDYTQYADMAGTSTVHGIHKFTDAIDEKTYTVGSETKTFEDIIGYSSDAVLESGQLKPRDYGEFRSWLQIPFIYFNKLFQIFNRHTKLVTGYDVVLDDKWFNKNNCYWTDLVMTLNTLEDSKDMIVQQIQPWFEWTSSLLDYQTNYIIDKGGYDEIPQVPLKFDIQIQPAVPIPKGATVSLGSTSMFLIENYESAYRYDERGREYVDYYSEQVSYNTAPDYRQGEYLFPEMRKTGSNTYSVSLMVPFAFPLYYERQYDKVSLDMTAGFSNTAHPSDSHHLCFSYYLNGVEYPFEVIYAAIGNEKFSGTRSLGSETNISLNNLWDNTKKPFDIIMNYCKMFRIGVFVDDINKTITYKPFREYFRNYTIEDWTDKIDMSQDFNINYIMTDNKKLVFNVGDNKSDLFEQYHQSIGKKYAEYEFETNYNFNNNSKNLFENPNSPGISFTPYVLSYNDLIGTGTLSNLPEIHFILPTESFVCDHSTDNKHSSVFGQLFFMTNIVRFDDRYNLPKVYITNDEGNEGLSKPCFTRNSRTSVETLYYPMLTRIYDGYYVPVQMGYSLNFSESLKKFDNLNPISEKNLYNIFWDNFMVEQYNSGSKKFECFVHLSLKDFYKYQPNKFIEISNQLCLLNKIYDYTPGAITTKCEFITINDLNAFIETDFQTESVQLSTSYAEVDRGTSFQINLFGTGFWTVENITELGSNGITVSPNNGELEDTTRNPYVITISTTSTTPLGNYQIKFTTTGVYGDIFKASFDLTIK